MYICHQTSVFGKRQKPLFLDPVEGCLGAFGPTGRPSASSWGLLLFHICLDIWEISLIFHRYFYL